jgi:hypothetical protein
MNQFAGGCLCGNVRLVASGLPRKHHGALFHASAVFPQDAVTIDGETGVYSGINARQRRDVARVARSVLRIFGFWTAVVGDWQKRVDTGSSKLILIS